MFNYFSIFLSTMGGFFSLAFFSYTVLRISLIGVGVVRYWLFLMIFLFFLSTMGGFFSTTAHFFDWCCCCCEASECREQKRLFTPSELVK